MDLKEKLLDMYYSGELTEAKMTSLRKFISMTGRDYTKMTPQQIDKIANTSAYKQFRKLRSLLRMQQKSEQLKRKLQNEDLINEYRRAPELGTFQRKSHLDVGQWHKHQTHAKKGQKLKKLKSKVLSAASMNAVDVHSHPGYMLYRSTGPRGFLATRKGMTTLRGKTFKKSYYESKDMQEAKIDGNLETPELKSRTETKPFSKKTERILQKAKEIKLNKDDQIIINPNKELPGVTSLQNV